MTFSKSGFFEKLEDGSKQTRRLPHFRQNLKLVRSRENLPQSSQKGHLEKLGKFQGNPETPPECPNRSKKAEAGQDSESWIQNPDVGGHLELCTAAVILKMTSQ